MTEHLHDLSAKLVFSWRILFLQQFKFSTVITFGGMVCDRLVLVVAYLVFCACMDCLAQHGCPARSVLRQWSSLDIRRLVLERRKMFFRRLTRQRQGKAKEIDQNRCKNADSFSPALLFVGDQARWLAAFFGVTAM